MAMSIHQQACQVAAMKVDGRCHCGFITYEAEVDPDSVDICNCTDCQTLSGSAFRVVVQAVEGSFRLLSGKPSIYLKAADSGNRRIQAFCPRCATPIISAPPTASRVMSICALERSANAANLFLRPNIGIGIRDRSLEKISNQVFGAVSARSQFK